jgi:hypothetical protein
MLQLLDDRRTVGLVLHQLGARFGPLRRHHANSFFGLRHIHPFAALI